MVKMACGKPPNPQQMTPPAVGGRSSAGLAREHLLDVLETIRTLTPGPEFDRQLKRAQRWYERAVAEGRLTPEQRAEFEGRLLHIQAEAQRVLREVGAGKVTPSTDRTTPEAPKLP